MMMVANQELSAELAKATNWTTLYWWNLIKPKQGKLKWILDNKKASAKSIPAYNFDYLFEKLRPVFLTQEDQELLRAFKVLLKAPNPANSLAELAISLAEKGLLK